MTSRALSARVCLVVLTLIYAAWAGFQPSAAAEQEKVVVGKKPVTITLKISDQTTGLKLEATKSVSSGTNAFDVLRDTVTVRYKTFPKLGPFVTGLCGVDAPNDWFWALYVDGKFSNVGIGSITLEKDTLIEWKTQKVEK